MLNQTKVCSLCNKSKQLFEFHKDTYKKLGITSACKKCRNKVRRIWDNNNSEKKKQSYMSYKNLHPDRVSKHVRSSKLKKAYGIDNQIFEHMCTNQGGLCAICGLPEIAKTPQGNIRPLSVDHNHSTNEVRGLLCSKCNLAIGLLKVDVLGVLNLQMAIKYIRETKSGKRDKKY